MQRRPVTVKNFCAQLLLAASMASGALAAPADLTLYAGRPLASYHVSVADFEASQVLEGESATVPKGADPKVPASYVGVRQSPGQALTLAWKDAWYASLRIEGGQPVDLRSYTTLALDLKVSALHQGGLAFKLGCGDLCARHLPYLRAARALEGKGWQPLVFSMQCFVRDGDDISAVSQPFALEASGSGEVAIANVRFQQGGTPNAACPDYKSVSVTPSMLDEAWAIDWWLKRHQAKLDEMKITPQTEIVFIGDSITQQWEQQGATAWQRHFAAYHPVNLGFGGDRTENVLWRLQHGAVDGIRPKVVVLMIGTNNTGSRQEDPRTTAAGIKRIVDELRQRLPATKILLFGIFPRDENAGSALRQLNDEVNAILARHADGKMLVYRNINHVFLDAEGKLSKETMPDFLHLSQTAYGKWAGEIDAELRKLLQP